MFPATIKEQNVLQCYLALKSMPQHDIQIEKPLCKLKKILFSFIFIILNKRTHDSSEIKMQQFTCKLDKWSIWRVLWISAVAHKQRWHGQGGVGATWSSSPCLKALLAASWNSFPACSLMKSQDHQTRRFSKGKSMRRCSLLGKLSVNASTKTPTWLKKKG